MGMVLAPRSGSLCASRIAGLGLVRWLPKRKQIKNSGAKHALCDREWTLVFFMIAGVNFALILSSLRGPASILHQLVLFLSLYHIPQPLSECSCIRVLYPRVISPRQPPSMVLEVYVLARTTFKFPRHLACRPIPTLSSDDGNGFDGQEHDPVAQSIQGIIGAVLESRFLLSIYGRNSRCL